MSHIKQPARPVGRSEVRVPLAGTIGERNPADPRARRIPDPLAMTRRVVEGVGVPADKLKGRDHG